MYSQFLALKAKHLPGLEATAEVLAQAVFLEDDHWRRHKAATANAIALAFNGS